MKKAKLLLIVIVTCTTNFSNAQTIAETVNYINSKITGDVLSVSNDNLDEKITVGRRTFRYMFIVSEVSFSVSTDSDRQCFLNIKCRGYYSGVNCIQTESYSNVGWVRPYGKDSGDKERKLQIEDHSNYTAEKVINAVEHLGKLLEERKNNELKRREQMQNSRPQHDNDPFAPQNFNRRR
jgi:hypothetical protein